METESLVDLIDKGIIKPLIGHPTDYADLPHFDSILQRKPPSVWARGDELAHRFAYAADYWRDARKALPLSKLTKVRWVREKWKNQNPALSGRALTEKVEMELCTNYVDLCIFGFEEQAQLILQLEDPSVMARKLIELNELATYPQLIGVGGTPHYGLNDRRVVEAARQLSAIRGDVKFFSREASLLLDGLKLSIPETIDAETVLSFHQENLAPRLWSAVATLEEEVRSNISPLNEIGTIDASLKAEQLITDAIAEVKSLDHGRKRRAASKWISVGLQTTSTIAISLAAAHAGLLPWQSLLAGLAVTNYANKNRPFDAGIQAIESKLSDWWMRTKTSQLATQLWQIQQWKDARHIR